MRSPSTPPKTARKSAAVTTGGRIVCVQRERTRRTSRSTSAEAPRRCAAWRSTAHPAREPVRLRPRSCREIEDREQLVGPLLGVALAHAEVAAVVDEHLACGEEAIEVHLLRREPKQEPGARVADGVV